MAIKQLIKRTSGWLYLNSSVGRNQLQGAGVILMLHRVLANDRAASLPHRNELCVGPKAFEHLLVWLRKHFDCVPLMEILQPNSLRTERPRVALTFDDGWRDNADVRWVLPLICRVAKATSRLLALTTKSCRTMWSMVTCCCLMMAVCSSK